MEPVTANRACVVTSPQSSTALWQRGVRIIIVHELLAERFNYCFYTINNSEKL